MKFVPEKRKEKLEKKGSMASIEKNTNVERKSKLDSGLVYRKLFQVKDLNQITLVVTGKKLYFNDTIETKEYESVISNVKNGKWKMIKCYNDEDDEEKVFSLFLHHQSFRSSPKKWKFNPDEKDVISIAVDTGSICVFDAKMLKSLKLDREAVDNEMVEFMFEPNSVGRVIVLMKHQQVFGFEFSTEYGDGLFDVHKIKNKQGEIVGIRIRI